jgi:hypothetical protein
LVASSVKNPKPASKLAARAQWTVGQDEDPPSKHALRLAIWRQDLAKIKSLLENNASLEDCSMDDEAAPEPALAIAAQLGCDKAVELLIKAGARLDAKNQQGMTAVLLAASVGSAKSMAAPLAAGADVQSRDPLGRSVLDLALEAKRTWSSCAWRRESVILCVQWVQEACALRERQALDASTAPVSSSKFARSSRSRV